MENVLLILWYTSRSDGNVGLYLDSWINRIGLVIPQQDLCCTWYCLVNCGSHGAASVFNTLTATAGGPLGPPHVHGYTAEAFSRDRCFKISITLTGRGTAYIRYSATDMGPRGTWRNSDSCDAFYMVVFVQTLILTELRLIS